MPWIGAARGARDEPVLAYWEALGPCAGVASLPVGLIFGRRYRASRGEQHMRNPILRELLHNALETIADEVGAVAARNAYSPFVNQMSGIATGLFDSNGRLIAQTRGGEFHCSAVRLGLQELLKETPGSSMDEGDVFILNDHFRGGIHPTDVMVLKPIFVEKKLTFFHGSLMIVSDLGGVSAAGLPGNATECFHEGVMIPGHPLVPGR